MCFVDGRKTWQESKFISNTGANAGSTVSTKPNAHDFSMLDSIYAHLDSTTTVASTPGPVASAAAHGNADVDITDDPASWGALTHVFWTNEAAANCPSCDHRCNYRE
jgi:hypothetical protein